MFDFDYEAKLSSGHTLSGKGVNLRERKFLFVLTDGQNALEWTLQLKHSN